MFFARPSPIMKFRCTAGWCCEMSIAPSALSALRRKVPLPRFGEVEFEVAGLCVEHLRSNGDFYYGIFTIFPKSVRTLSVLTPLRFMLRIVSEVQQGIQPLIRFKPDIASVASITAGWTAAGHKLLTPESSDAVSAVASFYLYLCSIDEHLLRFYKISAHLKFKSVASIAQSDALDLFERRSILKGFGSSRMYTFEPPDLYSEDALRGAFSGQHPT